MKHCSDTDCLPHTDTENCCESCTLGKIFRTSCPKKSENRANRAFEVVHIDASGFNWW